MEQIIKGIGDRGQIHVQYDGEGKDFTVTITIEHDKEELSVSLSAYDAERVGEWISGSASASGEVKVYSMHELMDEALNSFAAYRGVPKTCETCRSDHADKRICGRLRNYLHDLPDRTVCPAHAFPPAPPRAGISILVS